MIGDAASVVDCVTCWNLDGSMSCKQRFSLGASHFGCDHRMKDSTMNFVETCVPFLILNVLLLTNW